MKKNFFVGIDVSKQTIDVAFIMQQDDEKTQPCWKVFENNEKGFYEMQVWLQNNQVPFNENSLFVIENTGLYHRLLVKFCNKHELRLCIENGAQVKWSLGIARGKSDKVDSRRLAVYAARRRLSTLSLLPRAMPRLHFTCAPFSIHNRNSCLLQNFTRSR